LRQVQAPVKERYRNEPRAAVVTLRAEGQLGEPHISCRVETRRALVEAGLHPATGGNGQLACSGDMLLRALVSNRRAPKWDQEGPNETTRKVDLNCEDTRLRW
jgi:hypothetical protein